MERVAVDAQKDERGKVKMKAEETFVDTEQKPEISIARDSCFRRQSGRKRVREGKNKWKRCNVKM